MGMGGDGGIAELLQVSWQGDRVGEIQAVEGCVGVDQRHGIAREHLVLRAICASAGEGNLRVALYRVVQRPVVLQIVDVRAGIDVPVEVVPGLIQYHHDVRIGITACRDGVRPLSARRFSDPGNALIRIAVGLEHRKFHIGQR